MSESIGMALAGNYPRSSVRALIVKNGKLLCNRCEKNGEKYYVLPGGGQDHQEDLFEALRRECMEEIGCQIEIHELVFVYDYIAARDGYMPHNLAGSNFHAIHHVFWCDLKDPENLGKDTLMDANQTGTEWLPLSSLDEFNFYPKTLVPSIQNPKEAKIYLGHIN